MKETTFAKTPTRETKIQDAGLSVRATNICISNYVYTVGDLMDTPTEVICKWTYLGAKGRAELIDLVQSLREREGTILDTIETTHIDGIGFVRVLGHKRLGTPTYTKYEGEAWLRTGDIKSLRRFNEGGKSYTTAVMRGEEMSGISYILNETEL